MACTGMKEIFMDRRGRRHFRSVGWFPLFALTVILTNLPTSIHSSDGCKDGEYRINELVTSSPGMINTEMTTNSMTETTVGCGNCSEKIKECIRCEHSNSSLVCQNCSHGYQLTDDNRNCTLVPPHTTPKQSDSTTIIIAVVVSVGGVIIIVAIIVAIVFAARKGKLEKCHCACARSRSPTPPPMPSADDLGVSFKKDDNESGTGQRVDLLRYTEEPGVPQNRVESVHYDGYIGPREDDDDVYMNDIPMANIPATVQEEEEEDDELYVNNTGFSSPANQSNANTSRNTKTTPVASGSNTTTTSVASGSKPPRPKPKPQTPAKPTSATKPKAQPEENRISIFPPEDPDDIYLNEQELKGADDDDEDDKEDYVNAEDYEPGKR